jgi:hypothetical protein
MRTVEQIGLAFSDLDFDEDPKAEAEEGLILLSELISALYAPGRKPKPHIIGAVVCTLQKLRPHIENNRFVECEEIFQYLLDEISDTGEYPVEIVVDPEITEKVLKDAVFSLQTWFYNR